MKDVRATRKKMIDSATELFHLKGVKGTSIDDVLKKSKTGKSQFTHYFKTKDGLIKAVIDDLHDIIKSGAAPTGYNLKTWKDFDGWFEKYIGFQEMVKCELSCPLATIGNDLTDDQELLRQHIKMFFQWCTSQLARFFAERKAAGELKSSADPDALADFCLTVMEGGMLMAKIERDTETFANAANQAKAYVKSIRI